MPKLFTGQVVVCMFQKASKKITVSLRLRYERIAGNAVAIYQ